MAEWASARGVTLISDEIYQEIYYGEGDRAPGVLDLDPDAVGDLVVTNRDVEGIRDDRVAGRLLVHHPGTGVQNVGAAEPMCR